MRSIEWWEYTSEEIREMAGGMIAVQPIGSTEQHGPHLPVSTDSIIAQAFTERLKKKVRENDYPALFLPMLPFSKSNEHMDFPGTVAMSAQTMYGILMDIGASCARAGFKKLVFVNAHGGNTEILGVACREIRIETGLLTFAIMPSLLPRETQDFEMSQKEQTYGIHAGLTETSAVMLERPELVRADKMVDSTPEYFDHTTQLGFNFGVQFGWKAQDISRTGAVGNPIGSTPEIGEKWLDGCAEELYKAMLDIREFELYK